jgi:hypothetical protein
MSITQVRISETIFFLHFSLLFLKKVTALEVFHEGFLAGSRTAAHHGGAYQYIGFGGNRVSGTLLCKTGLTAERDLEPRIKFAA